MPTVTCAACGAEIDPAEHPSTCPACGSGDRLIGVADEGHLTPREQVRLKQTWPGAKEPYEERKVGDDLHRDTGQWNRVEQIVDRDGDRYRKLVTDPDGHVLRDVDEQLSQHRGHGSAKRPAKGPPSA